MMLIKLIYAYRITNENNLFVLFKEDKEHSYDSFEKFAQSVATNVVGGWGLKYSIPPQLPGVTVSDRSLLRRLVLDNKTRENLEKVIQEALTKI